MYNFNLKKFLIESKLNTTTPVEEATSARVQEVYDKFISSINKVARTLTVEENHELREKLTKFFTGEVF
jgi:hypothetical protein